MLKKFEQKFKKTSQKCEKRQKKAKKRSKKIVKKPPKKGVSKSFFSTNWVSKKVVIVLPS